MIDWEYKTSFALGQCNWPGSDLSETIRRKSKIHIASGSGASCESWGWKLVIHSISPEYTAMKQAPENLECGLGLRIFKKILGDANV
jgi:hypothetical protein